ncbi:unnamed protein product [Trichobilharzia szidati]|nr:unnamed protein product [Trichobilharzia szidati]
MHLLDLYSLVIRCGGVFLSYLVYGIYQEKITKTKYGPEKEPFNFYLSLLLLQCAVNFIFAKIVLKLNPESPSTAKGYKFAMCGFAYITAMFASNTSLSYVSYPTQVVGKSIKPVPVMLLSVLLGKRRYPLQKYIFMTMISVGVALFMFKGHSTVALTSNFGFGELLLLCSLLFDGITAGLQEDLKRHNVGPCTLMSQMNFWSVIFILAASLATGEVLTFVKFVERHPHVLPDMAIFSVISAVGQLFLFGLITNFSPLTCSVVTTTRKFFTVLFSIILFSHTMTNRQWIGTVCVFSGLLLDQIYGKTPSKQTLDNKNTRNGTVKSVNRRDKSEGEEVGKSEINKTK